MSFDQSIPPAPPTAPAPALDIGRCLNDAAAVYRQNFLTFLLAAILFDLVSLCSLLVLAGPLCGGMVILCLRAMDDPKHEARLGDLFAAFHRFGPLVAVFFLTAIPIVCGAALLIIPGVILSALWLFPTYLLIDRQMGAIDAMRASWRIVLRRGLWINVALAAILFAIGVGPMIIPYVGWAVSWLLMPLAWLMNTSAYVQEVRECGDCADLLEPRRGFPVATASVYDPTPAPAPGTT